jgi:integrase
LNNLYGPGIPETEVGSYQFANRWWLEKQGEIDTTGRPQRQPLPFEDVAAALLRVESLDDLPPDPGQPGVPQFRSPESIQRLIQSLQMMLAEHAIENGGQALDGLQYLPAARRQEIEGALTVISGEKTTAERTVEVHAKEWLKSREVKVGAGELSLDRFKNDGYRLKHFVAFVGPDADISSVTEKVLNEFNQHCKSKVAAQRNGDDDGWKPIYARQVFGTAEVFLRWLIEQGTIPHLRNLGSSSHRFRLHQEEKPTRTVEEFKAALAVAPERTRLYLLLGVNCGMYAGDMSNLKASQVDWERGRIKRKRDKTQHLSNTPEVDYPLWPTTFELLKKFKSDDPNHVILTDKGKLLVPRGTRNDAVMRAYETLHRLSPGFQWTPKVVRSFVSSLLRTSDKYGRDEFIDLFLGHAPRAMADKHYARPAQALFDEAVIWLGRQLDQVPAESKSASSKRTRRS